MVSPNTTPVINTVQIAEDKATAGSAVVLSFPGRNFASAEEPVLGAVIVNGTVRTTGE
jgi:hypothetical protein